MKTENYDVDYFIRKFEAIPEEKWCIKSLKEKDGARCALGHCLQTPDEWKEFCSKETVALSGILNRAIHVLNNGDDEDYQQPTPKQRVLAALYDIKAS